MSRGGALGAFLAQGLLLLLLLGVVFPGVFFRGHMIAPGDLLFLIPPWQAYAPEGFVAPQNPLMSDVITAFFPYYALTDRALAEGAWPLWNPLEYAGMPLLANCQTAVFYPPRLLHGFLELRLATTLYILLKLWLCGMTAFLCARGMGFSLGIARFVSIAWMLASYNLIWANWSLPDVSVWLPLLLLGVEWILQQRYRGGILVMALAGTMLLLAGHPETAFAMGLGTGYYFVLRLLVELPRPQVLWRPVAACLLAWTLALCVAMPQLLPFLEYLPDSVTASKRPVPYPFFAIANFFMPRFFGASVDNNYWGSENSNVYSMLYPGMGVWLGVFALSARGQLSSLRRRQAIALALAGLLAMLMAFGAPAFEAVHELPVFNMKIPVYHAVFLLFALPLLAAIGLEHWLAQPRPVGQWARVLLILLMPAALLGILYQFHEGLIGALRLREYLGHQFLFAGVVALAGLLALLLQSLRPAPRLFLALFAGILALDLVYANRRLNPTMPGDQVFPRTELTSYLQSLGPQRVSIATGFIPSGLFAPYGIEEWLAYDGLYPGRMHRFQTGMGPDLYTAMEPACAIGYYLHHPELPPQFPLDEPGYFERVAAFDGLEVYRNLRAFPRAFLAAAITTHPDLDSVLHRMKQAEFDPAREVPVLDTPETRHAAAGLPEAEGPPPGSTELLRHESTRVTVRAQTEHPGVLVLADAFYPGWKAYVDGVRTPIFPAYEVFRGIVLPAGDHTVEFVYRPGSFYLGMAISLLTLLLSAGYLLLSLRPAGPGIARGARA